MTAMPATKFAPGIDLSAQSGRGVPLQLDNGDEAAWSLVPYPNGIIDCALPDRTQWKATSAFQYPRDGYYKDTAEAAGPMTGMRGAP